MMVLMARSSTVLWIVIVIIVLQFSLPYVTQCCSTESSDFLNCLSSAIESTLKPLFFWLFLFYFLGLDHTLRFLKAFKLLTNWNVWALIHLACSRNSYSNFWRFIDSKTSLLFILSVNLLKWLIYLLKLFVIRQVLKLI